MQLRALPTILVVGAALAVIMLAACGTDEESAPTAAPFTTAAMAAPTAAAFYPTAAMAAPAAPTAAMIAPTPASAAAAPSTSGDGPAGSDKDGNGSADAADGELAKLASNQRIVVRTMDMGLVVANIQGAMDRIASVAANMGGWTVSSERSDDFSGKVAVRVPADRLDEAVAQVRGAATEVEWEISTSEDVTAEYYDSQSRIRNLRATETAMLNLLERAPDAEDALAIRNSLTEVQEDLEVLLGRIKLLEETSAFSLINVTMRVQRVDLNVEAGPDRTVSIGQTVRFKATFRAPDDSSTYRVEWDFGDRSRPTVDSFTAPTTEPGTRVTAAVTHVFADYRDSPYFVDVRIWGGSGHEPAVRSGHDQGDRDRHRSDDGGRGRGPDGCGGTQRAVPRVLRAAGGHRPIHLHVGLRRRIATGTQQPRHPDRGLEPDGHRGDQPRLRQRRGVAVHRPDQDGRAPERRASSRGRTRSS